MPKPQLLRKFFKLATRHLDTCGHRPEALRFEPPLNIKREEIDRAIETLDETCGESKLGFHD